MSDEYWKNSTFLFRGIWIILIPKSRFQTLIDKADFSKRSTAIYSKQVVENMCIINFKNLHYAIYANFEVIYSMKQSNKRASHKKLQCLWKKKHLKSTFIVKHSLFHVSKLFFFSNNWENHTKEARELNPTFFIFSL